MSPKVPRKQAKPNASSLLPVLRAQLKAEHHLLRCSPNVGTSLDLPSSSLLCLDPLGPASQMPLESTQPHGRCLSSRPQPPSPGLPPPATFCLGPAPSTDPCPPPQAAPGLSSQAYPQHHVCNNGYTSVAICKGLSELLKACRRQVDAVGWRGPEGQVQTLVRPVGVKLNFALQLIMTLVK